MDMFMHMHMCVHSKWGGRSALGSSLHNGPVPRGAWMRGGVPLVHAAALLWRRSGGDASAGKGDEEDARIEGGGTEGGGPESDMPCPPCVVS